MVRQIPSMRNKSYNPLETKVVRSKSELTNEIQRLPIAKSVVYRNADRKAWEATASEHQGGSAVVVIA